MWTKRESRSQLQLPHSHQGKSLLLLDVFYLSQEIKGIRNCKGILDFALKTSDWWINCFFYQVLCKKMFLVCFKNSRSYMTSRNSKWDSQRLGNLSLESNDVMTSYYDVTLWCCICAQKQSLFHQEDHLISRISYSTDNDWHFMPPQWKQHHDVMSKASSLYWLTSLVNT